MDKALEMLEEKAIDAYENGNEQEAYDLYVELISKIEDIEEGSIHLELMSCEAYDKKHCGHKRNGWTERQTFSSTLFLSTWVDEFFTEEHRKDLKEMLEDAITDYIDGSEIQWDMTMNPRSWTGY